jgi:hypothetical protein
MTRRAAALLMAVLAVLAILLAACGGGSGGGATGVHVQPEPAFALPSKADGCARDPALPASSSIVPVKVSKVAGQVAESVNVCIGDQGPFPFILDTGDGASTIDAGLAHRLHLTKVGPSEAFEGVGCTGRAQPVTVPSWSVSGIPLNGQALTAATIPGLGGKNEPDGLLGSDVLSTFGAVRLDFRAGLLTLGGAQGPAATSSTAIHGPVGPPPVALGVVGPGVTVVALTVILAPGGTSLQVPVRLGNGKAHTFAVDTGSSQSVLATDLATAAHLAASNQAQRQTTVCSTITSSMVHSGPWSLPGVTLHPQLIDEADFGPISAGGVVGLLGSDQLIRYGWVVFDYTGGRLYLG